MKNYINKSAKRILSLALALIMLAGCLFTANLGMSITANAENEGTDPYADWDNVQYWDGTVLPNFDGWTPVNGKYVIDTAAKLQLACSATKAEWWRADNVNTFGKSFVIDENVDAFIMQPKEVVDKLGIAAFVEASGAEETRQLFEEKFAAIGATPVNWSTNTDNAIFAGNFDGSEVPIYGIYADGITKGIQNVGFFPMTEGSSTNKGASGAPVTDATGIDIRNLVIKNCYFKGFRRVGILSGGGWYNGGGMLVDGCVNVDSCVVANCYVLGQNYYITNAGEKKLDESWLTGEMGLLFGNASSDPIKLSNSLVYGNETRYDTYAKNDSDVYEITSSEEDAINWLFKANQNNSAAQGSIKNCVILDAVVNNLIADSTTYCENVYSNTYTTYKNTVTNIIDHASVKGAHGRFYMSGLGWDSAWWAIENDYPTPFKPYDSYKSVEAKEFAGSGTAEDPYLIYGAKQLDTMVSEGGIRNGDRAHYKVAKGVEEIYLNNAKTKEEAKALYDSSKYNNWIHGTTCFEGTFDGNGVTIYGMISSNKNASGNVGFVSKIGATHTALNVPAVTTSETTVTIKNVNFVGAYIDSSSLAAVVASSVAYWRDTSADGTRFEDSETNDIKPRSYITNVSVRDSSINSQTEFFASDATTHGSGSAAGILAMDLTPDHVVVSNCLYDGGSCELVDGDSANGRKTAKAGIVSMATGHNELTIENCVAIDEYAIPMVSGVTYGQYNSQCEYYFNTVYGKYNSEFDKADYNKLTNCYGIAEGKTNFSTLDMPLLNWGGAWNLVEYDGRMIPMPKTSDKTIYDYSSQLAKQNNGKGATLPSGNRFGGYEAGKYGMYEAFLGSGTEEDPYIISNALDLARAIACGGKDVTTKLYYKLACDINVGATWLTTNSVAGKYVYVPFEGTLDGDGHTIYNLYSISTGNQQGLIPQVADGATIKNLHIRDSYIYSGGETDKYTPGALFGSFAGEEGKVYIEGCSYESDNEGTVRLLVSDFSKAETTNSYSAYKDDYKYYESCKWDNAAGDLTGTFTHDDNNYVPTPENADFYGEESVENPVWYMGASGNPRLVNRAKAMTEVDVSGLGDNDYAAEDLTALRQRLLGNKDYANVYGDVSHNGVTNLSDLAILGRQLVHSYNKIADGFWRNAALGNVVIYYGENDNYDFARKLELALEAEFGKDVKKVVVTSDSTFANVSYGSKSGGLYVHKNDICTDGTTYYKLVERATGAIEPEQIKDSAAISKYALDGKCQIVVGNIPGKTTTISDVDTYQISVDEKNAEIWLQGGSFTAVEQATLDFINESNPDINKLYEVESGTLDSKKKARTDIVNGQTYYYAWGDEFDSTSLHKDKWNYDGMQNETSVPGGYYANLEVAFPEDIEKLYTTVDENGNATGKLTIWRGYYADAEDTNASWGYKWLGSQKYNDNKFGGTVETGDIYVTAGKIVTNKSMLVKQGYLELKASYPEDGHAFPCWWLVGYSGGTIATNDQIGNTLFGKVFKLNNEAAYSGSGDTANAWDGRTNDLNSSVPSTFKYQLPHSSFEIDIAEFMQMGDNAYKGYDIANFTFHKFFGNGIYTNASGDKAIKFINWNSLLTGGSEQFYGISRSAKRSGSYNNYTYTYSDTDKIYEFYPEKVTELDGYWTYSSNYTKTWNGGMKTSEDGGAHFTATPGTVSIVGGQEYIFGVKWEVNDTNVTYTFTVKNADTGEDVLENPLTITEDIAYNKDTALASSGDKGFLENLSSKIETDKQTANQYMYMLIDNTYATSEEGSTSNYDDLLSQNSSNNKIAKMEIDYVRVYQLDDKRDIVTPDTEEFNNGNHFGY